MPRASIGGGGLQWTSPPECGDGLTAGFEGTLELQKAKFHSLIVNDLLQNSDTPSTQKKKNLGLTWAPCFVLVSDIFRHLRTLIVEN